MAGMEMAHGMEMAGIETAGIEMAGIETAGIEMAGIEMAGIEMAWENHLFFKLIPSTTTPDILALLWLRSTGTQAYLASHCDLFPV